MDTTAQDPARGRVPDFRHEALVYAGDKEFVEEIAAFVRDAFAADEAVMVAVVEPRATLLRWELGSDAARVRFLDMADVGRNPARIIPAWQAWCDEQRAAGRRFRGVGEPVWAGRSAAELVECRHHEALLNTAFDDGPGWWLLCPYDASRLDAVDVAFAAHTHPSLLTGHTRRTSTAYPDADLAPASLLAAPLPAPAGPIQVETGYGLRDLFRLRTLVEQWARAAGMTRRRATDLVLAVNELATNTVLHGGGTGVLRMWSEDRELVAEIRDRGRIRDPLVGRRKPAGSPDGGAGLWMANQLCDLVQIRSDWDTGTTIRVRMRCP